MKDDQAVLALTVMLAIEAVPGNLRTEALALVHAGAPWHRIAAFLIASSRKEVAS